jgi:hypothetical protein
LWITVREYTRSGEAFRIRVTLVGIAILGLRTRERQPLPASHFLPTINQPRTWAVPLNGSNFDIVPARDQGRALWIAWDGVEGLTGCIDDYRVNNVGFTAGDLELDGWSLVGMMGSVDQSGAQRSKRGWYGAVAVSVWVFASGYPSGVGGSGGHASGGEKKEFESWGWK